MCTSKDADPELRRSLYLPSTQSAKHMFFTPWLFNRCPSSRRVQNKPNFASSSSCEGSVRAAVGINHGWAPKKAPVSNCHGVMKHPLSAMFAYHSLVALPRWRRPYGQSDALASHRADAVTYSRNSFSHFAPSLRGAHVHARCLYACMSRHMAHRVFII